MGGTVLKEEISLMMVDLRLFRKEWCEAAVLLLFHALLKSISTFNFTISIKKEKLTIVNHRLE